jgi:hypothetical protein
MLASALGLTAAQAEARQSPAAAFQNGPPMSQIRALGAPGMCVDTDGAIATIELCDAARPSQYWVRYAGGGLGNYAKPGDCLAVWGGEGPNRNAIVLKSCKAADGWQAGAGRTIRIGSLFGATCLDVPQNRFIAGQPLAVWTCHGESNQRFRYDAFE